MSDGKKNGIEWFTQERRYQPTPGEQYGLLRRNITELATRLEGDRHTIIENRERIGHLEYKCDEILAAIEQHKVDTREMLAAFRFQRKLRKWALGLAAGLALLVGLAHQMIQLWHTTKP